MNIKKRLFYFFSLFSRLLLIALGLIFFIIALSLITSWSHWRTFSQEALNGKNQLNIALTEFKNKNWEAATQNLQDAENSFTKSSAEIKSLRVTWFPAKLGLGAAQLNDLQYLNDSALIIASSAKQASKLAQNISASAFDENSNFENLSTEKKAQFLQSLIALEPELNGLKANLNLTLINLNRIQKFGILWPLRGQLQAVKKQISDGEIILNESLPIIRLLPAFSGYPDPANYLIVLQNNDELRPTGGFLGSYVRVDIADFGKIKQLKADDVYHLDMPAIGQTKYVPPKPIAQYLKVENWYLRDANWSPDWPQSARLIQEMFQAESRAAGQVEPDLDGILAITPNFVANLLRLTGPITVRGESYAAENMQALLQYNVEVAYKDNNISSWDRKDIINELIKELEKKLLSLPLNQYPELIARLHDSLKRGDILLYFNQPEQQALAVNLGGAGEIKQVDGDYLMVVDANLAAFKSDAVMKKDLSYNVSRESDKLKSVLRLNYKHGGGFDWRTTRYRSYTRVLAPLGSQLKEIKGLNQTETDFISYDDTELNKHVFAFFWSIEPSQGREIIIEYYLPAALNESLLTNNLYNLYIQRQPGSRINSLSLALELNKPIIKFNPTNLNGEIKEKGAYWTIGLDESQTIQVLTK